MKKHIMSFVVMTALLCLLTIAASAVAVVDYDLVPAENLQDTYKIVATIKNPDGIYVAFKSDVTFDYSVIVPVSKTTGNAAPIETSNMVKTPINVTTYYDEVNEENVSVSFTPTTPSWTVSGTKATLGIETFTTVKTIDATELMAYEIYFKFADGKSMSDIKEDTFVIDYVKYTDQVTLEETYNHPTQENTLTVNNNVVPEAPAKLTIPVTTGDVIYFQDGTSAVAETTGDYEIPADDGYVTVNTGYDSQKVYLVESGVVSEQTDLRDGVLGTNASAIRNDRVASGIRFKSSFLTVLKSSVKEYGYLVTVESDYNDLPEDYELNMALVDSGKAKKGVAYSEADGIDISNGTEAERIVVTMVTTGVPLTKKAVQTNIVARPYYVLENGAVIYGEPATRQVIEVALAIKKEDGAAYNENKAYIDDIISLVSEEELEVIIQLGPLF